MNDKDRLPLPGGTGSVFHPLLLWVGNLQPTSCSSIMKVGKEEGKYNFILFDDK